MSDIWLMLQEDFEQSVGVLFKDFYWKAGELLQAL